VGRGFGFGAGGKRETRVDSRERAAFCPEEHGEVTARFAGIGWFCGTCWDVAKAAAKQRNIAREETQ